MWDFIKYVGSAWGKWKFERTGESVDSAIRQAKNREITEAATAAEKFSEPLQKRVMPLLEEALEANVKDIALTAKRKETAEERQQREQQARAISAEKSRIQEAAREQRRQDWHTQEVDHFRDETRIMAKGMMIRCWNLAVQHAGALDLAEFKFEWDAFLRAKMAWQLASLKAGDREHDEAQVVRLTELFDSGFKHLCRNLAPASSGPSNTNQAGAQATLSPPKQ